MAVKIYTTTTCPWCQRAKQFLKAHGVSYEDKDVASDQAALNEMIAKSGQLGVPVIDVEGEIIVGFDERRLREKLGIAP